MKKEIEYYLDKGFCDFEFSDGSLLSEKVVRKGKFKPLLGDTIETSIALVDDSEFDELKSAQVNMRQDDKSNFVNLHNLYFSQLNETISR